MQVYDKDVIVLEPHPHHTLLASFAEDKAEILLSNHFILLSAFFFLYSKCLIILTYILLHLGAKVPRLFP